MLFCSMLELFSLFFSISHFKVSLIAIQLTICFKSVFSCLLNDILSLAINRNKWKILEHRSQGNYSVRITL